MVHYDRKNRLHKGDGRLSASISLYPGLSLKSFYNHPYAPGLITSSSSPSSTGNPMKILALEKEIPNTTPEQFAPHLKAEATRVWELYKSGQLREIYFRGNRSEAVLILECADVEEAHSLLSTLPLVKEGLISFDVIPLVPYPGFERLFAKQG